MKAVVVIEPEMAENTGFIARLAANFGFELRLVNPDFNISEARKTASRAQDKLRDAKIFEEVEEAIKDLNFVAGTKDSKGQNLKDFTPREDTSLMIGRESSGLTNSELELCDAVVSIETGEYSSINQSHAAGILMHSFDSRSEKKGMTRNQKKTLEEIVQTPEIKELVKQANPSREEVNHLIGQIKSLE